MVLVQNTCSRQQQILHFKTTYPLEDFELLDDLIFVLEEVEYKNKQHITFHFGTFENSQSVPISKMSQDKIYYYLVLIPGGRRNVVEHLLKYQSPQVTLYNMLVIRGRLANASWCMQLLQALVNYYVGLGAQTVV